MIEMNAVMTHLMNMIKGSEKVSPFFSFIPALNRTNFFGPFDHNQMYMEMYTANW